MPCDGLALSILGFVLHAAAVLTRGFAAERVPWTNMFEFGLTATVVMMGTFVAVQLWKDLRYLGAYITGFVVLSLGIVTVNFYVDVVPTPPALQSAWLVIHVLVAALATAFFAIGAGLSIMQLMQARIRSSRTWRATLQAMAYRETSWPCPTCGRRAGQQTTMAAN